MANETHGIPMNTSEDEPYGETMPLRDHVERTLAQLYDQFYGDERKRIAQMPPGMRAEYIKQSRELKRKFNNKILYGNEEGVNE